MRTKKKHQLPKATFRGIQKFLTQAENDMKARVATLNRTGRMSNEYTLGRLMYRIERLQLLGDRGEKFRNERDEAIAYIWSKVAEVQKQPLSSLGWDDDSDPKVITYLETHNNLKKKLYGTLDGVYEEQDGWKDSGHGITDKRYPAHLVEWDEEELCD